MAITALKEWAEVIKALGSGSQIIVLRKGGIAEGRGGFSLREREFLLYPTYSHQRDELLKPEYRGGVNPSLPMGEPPDCVIIEYLARVTDTHEITSPKQIRALSPFYIQDEGYMLKRLRWKSERQLILLFLRVYRLASAITLSARPEYAGCKSWVDIDEDVDPRAGEPVIGDASYVEMATTISRQALVDV